VVVLITSALLPVDIFLVSFMKTQDGNWAEWAVSNETRELVSDSMQYSYYALYSIVFLFLFMIIPFVYFFFEEKDDDIFGSPRSRFCSALKFTLIFMLIAFALLMVGAFAPLKAPPASANLTEWERIEFLFNDLKKSRGEDAISMVLSILTLIGMVNLIFYTGFGMFSWPMGLIRGLKSARDQSEEIQEQHLVNQTRINALKDKQRIGGRLSSRELKQLSKLERSERNISRQEELVEEVRGSLWYKCRRFMRPIEVAIGCVLGLLAFLIWMSLLLTNIDKAMHGKGAGMGYVLEKRTLPNPIDVILVFLQKIFPLDYLLLFAITWFLILCTISGIRNLGIRILFVKMYRLKRRRTRPQALLLTCVTLMMTVLAINILMYCMSPQYVTFGSQQFIDQTEVNGTLVEKVTACDLNRVNLNSTDGDCVMTRDSALLTRFFYKAWFFGAAYYWCSWAFLSVSGLALVYVILRRTKAVTDDLDDEDDEDLEDDDPQRTRPARR
jgi:LMBR1 domain-containing protein 1